MALYPMIVFLDWAVPAKLPIDIGAAALNGIDLHV